MFKNYQNISDTYVPDNSSCSFPLVKSYTKLDPVRSVRPYEEVDSWGNIVGYFWNYGDTINLDFSITGELTLDDGTPDGTYIDASDFLADKTCCIRLYNFRFEEIYSKTFQGSNRVVLEIDSELSKSLTRGIYYCSMDVDGHNFHEKVFDATDCKLMVK